MFNQRLVYTNRLQLLFVYVFMCNTLETMKNKHEMSGKGKTVVFPCDNMPDSLFFDTSKDMNNSWVMYLSHITCTSKDLW